MTSSPCTRGCYAHFAKRVTERIGDHVEPRPLWFGLIQAIQDNDTTLISFVARINRSGRRLWRFTVEGAPFFVIYDHNLNCPVTVLPPDGEARRHSDLHQDPINLEDHI